MSNAQQFIPFAFGAVVVLLAANLLGGTWRPAEAGVAAGPTEPYIVNLFPIQGGEYLRVWSDGQVDVLDRDQFSCDFSVCSIGPVEHPFPVVDALQGSDQTSAVMMTFGDGRVDLVGFNFTVQRCTLAGIGTPSLWIADINRDGCVDAFDLSILLAEWCSEAGGNPCGTCGI